MNLTDLSNLVQWSRDEIQRLGCDEVLKSGVIERVRSGLGGSHTVATYPPLDALERVDSEHVISAMVPTEKLNLYLHLPFCERSCPYCHYDTHLKQIGYDSRWEDEYLESLTKELVYWKERLHGSTLKSIYVGGGTPTVIREEKLLALFEKAIDIPHEPDFKACIETSPLTTVAGDGYHRLASMVKAGVNRLSIGIQTFDTGLLRQSRGDDLNVILKALDIISEFNIEVNVDLIQDLPNQSDKSILKDIVHIDRFKPDQVTWYILRLRPDAGWHQKHMRGSLDVCNSLESARKRLLIRKAMQSIGYTPRPGGRFMRTDSLRDEFKRIRGGSDSTMLGIGVSAYSHGWGHIFRNIHSSRTSSGVKNYVAEMKEKDTAIYEGLPLSEIELAAAKLVQGIRAEITVPETNDSIRSYMDDVINLLDFLGKSGLVETKDDKHVSLTELGKLFEEEICSLFYSPAVKKTLEKKWAWWGAEHISEEKESAGESQPKIRSVR